MEIRETKNEFILQAADCNGSVNINILKNKLFNSTQIQIDTSDESDHLYFNFDLSELTALREMLDKAIEHNYPD